ncbi:MAG: choice-of-anchor Q domain-containing protein [Actinomycetes bacterium]
MAASLPLIPMAMPADAQVQLTVDSTLDEPDANVGDGLCLSTSSGKCTLRAALQEIDTGGTVTVPAGLYVLTIAPGTESDVGQGPHPDKGDLDISNEVTINGAGADRTIIDGTGTHRIFDIHGPAGNAHINKVTLRNGLADFSGFTQHVHGGIIHNHGTFELFESTLSGGLANTTTWGGGGITNAGTATLRNVTIARNTTTNFGGGIENLGTITLLYVTLTENSSPSNQGAGIAARSGTATVGNTILANNAGGNCFFTSTANLQSAGYNLQDNAACPFLSTGDQVGTPLLSPQNNNAGSIWVYALQAGSPALDKANPLVCPSTDERGVTRPQEGDGVSPAFCDIGAYELAPPAVTCDGQTAVIVGTAGDDEIQGTQGPDVIAGLGGNDEIEGRGGADRICGGTGSDELEGDDGNDRLFGQQGNDTLLGGAGNDRLAGGPQTDRCVGGGGTNTKISCER